MAPDVVIRGGTVVDGTGAPGRPADVAVTDGVVTEIGDRLDGVEHARARRVGQIVAPGFIDIHTHYDAQVFWDPSLTPVVVPRRHVGDRRQLRVLDRAVPPRAPRPARRARLQHVEDMSLATLDAGVPWDFETFPQYLDSVERHGTALNFGCYVGHTAVRIWVMGEAGYERAATDDELARMRAVVAEAMAAGAAGFATSSSPTHNGDGGRPVPSRLADLRELNALLEPLRDADAASPRCCRARRSSTPTCSRSSARIGRPLTWTALLTDQGLPVAREDHGSATSRPAPKAIEVWPQVSCRPLVFQMNLREPFTFNMRPIVRRRSWTAPSSERIAAYRDPAWRAKAWDELNGSGVLPPNWASLAVAGVEHASRAHRSAAARGRRGARLHTARRDARRLARGEPRDPLHERARQQRSRRDRVAAPAGDGAARARRLGRAREPALRRVLRDRPARQLGARPRGDADRAGDLQAHRRARRRSTASPTAATIATGKAADITVFDPDTVAPGPLRRVRDFPADGERLVADAPVGMLAHRS